MSISPSYFSTGRSGLSLCCLPTVDGSGCRNQKTSLERNCEAETITTRIICMPSPSAIARIIVDVAHGKTEFVWSSRALTFAWGSSGTQTTDQSKIAYSHHCATATTPLIALLRTRVFTDSRIVQSCGEGFFNYCVWNAIRALLYPYRPSVKRIRESRRNSGEFSTLQLSHTTIRVQEAPTYPFQSPPFRNTSVSGPRYIIFRMPVPALH